jgi:hypothetical protein
VLPEREEAPQLGGGHRLDLPAEPLERVTLNARQQPPLAPSVAAGQAAAQHRALGFQLEQARLVGGGQPWNLRPAFGAERRLGLGGFDVRRRMMRGYAVEQSHRIVARLGGARQGAHDQITAGPRACGHQPALAAWPQ